MLRSKKAASPIPTLKNQGFPMSKIDEKLRHHREQLRHTTLVEKFAADPARMEQWQIDAAGIHADLSKNHIDSPRSTGQSARNRQPAPRSSHDGPSASRARSRPPRPAGTAP